MNQTNMYHQSTYIGKLSNCLEYVFTITNKQKTGWHFVYYISNYLANFQHCKVQIALSCWFLFSRASFRLRETVDTLLLKPSYEPFSYEKVRYFIKSYQWKKRTLTDIRGSLCFRCTAPCTNAFANTRLKDFILISCVMLSLL